MEGKVSVTLLYRIYLQKLYKSLKDENGLARMG